MHTLFAYVDGSDLDEVEEELSQRFQRLLDGRSWSGEAIFVNVRHKPDDTFGPGDMPDWNLGINLDVDLATTSWRSDVEVLVRSLGELHRNTRRDFVVGLFDHGSGVAEDIWSIDSDSPDADALLRAISGRA